MHVLKLRVCGYGYGRVEHIRHLALPVQALEGLSKDPCTADTSFAHMCSSTGATNLVL